MLCPLPQKGRTLLAAPAKKSKGAACCAPTYLTYFFRKIQSYLINATRFFWSSSTRPEASVILIRQT